MQSGVLAHTESARRLQAAAAKLTHCPMCAACQFGKQRRRPAPGKRSHVVRERQHALRRDHLFPGQKVSVDHFKCTTRGRLPHTFGKEDPKQQYTGGAIFVDHATGYIYINHQVHLTTHETINAKENFEAHCRDHGVVVSEYLSDNGTAFTGQEYTRHLETFAQISQYAGVGAHHHNGVAERSIQTVMSIARTMLLHAAIHWPDVADAARWPLAVDHAVLLFNMMPDPATGLSPHDLFTKSRWPQNKFQDFHVWGCPVYVLAPTIADGKKLPRWKPRSTRSVYVGVSKSHASSVPLCLNLETGAITAQFHVVFDDEFATVASNPTDLPDFGSPQWQELFGDSSFQFVPDDSDLSEPEQQPADVQPPPRANDVAAAMDRHRPPQPLPVPPPARDPPPSPGLVQQMPPLDPPVNTPTAPPSRLQRENIGADPLMVQPSAPTAVPPLVQPLVQPEVPPLDQPFVPPTEPESPPHHQREHQREPPPQREPRSSPSAPSASSQRESTNSTASVRRRSARTRQPPQRFGYDGSQAFGYWSTSICAFLISIDYFGLLPAAFKARAVKDPDTFTYQEAMASEHKSEWLKAAQAEISALESKFTWMEVPLFEARSKVIPLTWVFKVKRGPSGDFKKCKARICVRGDLEEDDDVDNFAPVVAWSTVRIFLIICIILGWKTISIDFSNAFVQSILKDPVWVHLPRGFVSPKGPGHCLRLHRSLYGLRRSPKLWHETCLDGFKKLGFKQSAFDPCLLYKKGMMVIMYVDDC